MQILITGGTGFIGKQLCRTLLGQDHTLTLLSRQPGQKIAAMFDGRINPLASLSALTPDQKFDAVINLAGEPIVGPRWSNKRKTILRDSRIGITRELVDFIAGAESKPSLLVNGSAVGYYGDQGDLELDEDSGFKDDFGHQLCADWEQAADEACRYGVRVCILRTGLVIGRQGGFLKPMIVPFKLGLGGPIGSGRQWMPWIHIDDLVAMILLLLKSPGLSGIFNGTSPHPVTNREFTQSLAKAVNRPALLPVPAGLLKLALGEASTLLLGGQKVLPARFIEKGYRFKFDLLDTALKEVFS